MKRLSLFSILLWGMVSISMLSAVSNAAFAQPARTDHNSVYIELLGNGILYSVNYDRMFSESVGGRVGVMYISAGTFNEEENVNVTIVPAMVNYLVGQGKHNLELGLGAIFVFAARDFDEKGGAVDEQGVAGTATIGYRFQPPNGGFVFRVGATPVFSDSNVSLWGGLSFGFSF